MKSSLVFNNAKWIIVNKIIQSLLQFVIGMLTARFLGPSNYGLINYAASIASFLLPIMKLGLDATLVNELVKAPEKEGEIMGTSITLNILSAIGCMGAMFGFVYFANANETETIIVCVLYSTVIFTTALEMFQYWFQYKLLSKYSSTVMLIAYILCSIYKIYILATQKSIYWFALSNSIDYGIIGVLLIIIYFRLSKSKLVFSFELAKQLLSRSKHCVLAALMMVIFQNTDHIMLKFISGDSENGYYSAAITTIGITQFVYTAIIDSFRPLIFEQKNTDEEGYERNLSRLYGITIYLSLAQSIVFTIFANLIIYIIYGSDFAPAVPVMQILTWYYSFAFMGSVRNVWVLAEEKQNLLWLINLSGVIVNIVLNSILIPMFGACGAAAASLATQIFTNFILGFIIKPIRANNVLLLKGMSPKFVFKEAKLLATDYLKKKR